MPRQEIKVKNRSGGIGFLYLLTILFIALKLTGVINWSWLWVISPLLLPFAVVFIAFIVIGLIKVVCRSIEKQK